MEKPITVITYPLSRRVNSTNISNPSLTSILPKVKMPLNGENHKNKEEPMHTKPEEFEHLFKQIKQLAHGQTLTDTVTLADQNAVYEIVASKSANYHTDDKSFALVVKSTTDTLTAQEAIELLQAQTQTVAPTHYTTEQLKILQKKIKRELKTRYKEQKEKKKTA
jgi:hypothetical protein